MRRDPEVRAENDGAPDGGEEVARGKASPAGHPHLHGHLRSLDPRVSQDLPPAAATSEERPDSGGSRPTPPLRSGRRLLRSRRNPRARSSQRNRRSSSTRSSSTSNSRIKARESARSRSEEHTSELQSLAYL